MAARPHLRTLLGTWSDLGTWQRVYETPEALEVDESNGFAGARRRVFYDEVLLVTRHRATGWAFMVPAAVLVLLAVFMALSTAVVSGAAVGAGVSLFALPPLAFMVARLTVKKECITVFGRRSRARVCFWLRKEKAARAFERVCARVRHAQQRTAQPTEGRERKDDSEVA